MPKITRFKSGGKLFNRLLDGAVEARLADVPEGYDLERYKRAFEDDDLVETCFCLFDNNLNVSATACKLYMHRNTLIYRIAKLKRLTGLDVCKFSDALTFIILYRYYCEGEAAK